MFQIKFALFSIDLFYMFNYKKEEVRDGLVLVSTLR
jgi:hypothetical protein